jgi:dCMP deaminase
MEMAELVSTRSTCTRRKIGSIIVKDKQVLSTGYNGAPRGLPHCLDIGCLRDELNIASGTRHEICRAVHAEQNAIVQCGAKLAKGSTIYVNVKPCKICAKLIINAGISRVVYQGDYPDDEGLELLREAGVQVDRFE